jgi:hypothetical protein
MVRVLENPKSRPCFTRFTFMQRYFSRHHKKLLTMLSERYMKMQLLIFFMESGVGI